MSWRVRPAYSRTLCLPHPSSAQASYHSFPWVGKLAHSAAPPLPTETASLGFRGDPVRILPLRGISALNALAQLPSLLLLSPTAKSHTAAYTGLSGVAAVGAITTLGARCVLLKRWTAREKEGVLCRFTRSAHRLPEQTERPVFQRLPAPAAVPRLATLS